MEEDVEGTEYLVGGQQIVRTPPRWLANVVVFVVVFAIGVGVGALAFGLLASEQPQAAVDGAVVVGCGDDVTLIVDANGLNSGTYQLRASVGDRMLPMINAMTYPLIGTHRDHQEVVPDDGRLLLVANVPLGKGQALRYELVGDEVVGDDTEVYITDVLQPNTCSPTG